MLRISTSNYVMQRFCCSWCEPLSHTRVITCRLAKKRNNHSLPHHWFNAWRSLLINLTILYCNAPPRNRYNVRTLSSFLWKTSCYSSLLLFSLHFRIILLLFRTQLMYYLFYLLSVIQKPFFVLFSKTTFIS